jgi:hypothetical protein
VLSSFPNKVAKWVECGPASTLCGISKIYLDAIRGPRRNAASKEILILRPHWNAKEHRNGHDWPITRVSELDSLASKFFVTFVQALECRRSNRLCPCYRRNAAKSFCRR